VWPGQGFDSVFVYLDCSTTICAQESEDKTSDEAVKKRNVKFPLLTDDLLPSAFDKGIEEIRFQCGRMVRSHYGKSKGRTENLRLFE
jgi:hypothetical protein